jgi:hypothetical protein
MATAFVSFQGGTPSRLCCVYGSVPDLEVRQTHTLTMFKGHLHGRGAHLLFRYFVAAGTSLAAVMPARAAATSLPHGMPAPASSPHAGIHNKSSALTSPHKTPHHRSQGGTP